MIRHILKTFLRTSKNSKLQLITTITGLTIGIAVSLLIYIHIDEETAYDLHHAHAEQLHRIHTVLDMEGKIDRTAKAGLNTGKHLTEFFHEVEDNTQLLNISKQTIQIGEDLYSSELAVYADSSYFTFFDYFFIEGNPRSALDGPNKMVISEEVAIQFFGNATNAYGQNVQVNNRNYEVTGVYNLKGRNTHMPYNIFLSLSTLPKDFLDIRDKEYFWITTYNYIKLKKGVTAEEFEGRLEEFYQKILIPHVEKNEVNGSITFEIGPVTNIHLDNTLNFDRADTTNPIYLKIFSATAILTLLIALINYINLTTAGVSKRLKEIGIKKCIGANRGMLIFQFVSESIACVTFSYIIALGIVFLSLPKLRELTGTSIGFTEIINLNFLLLSAGFIMLFGLVAGIYPALVLSSMKPLTALKASTGSIAITLKERLVSPGFVRKVLVTVQFSISVFLIIGTLVVFGQFHFMSNRELGFDKEQVLVIDVPSDTAISNHLDVIKDQLSKIAAVKSVSSTASIPGSDHGALTMNISQSGGSEIKVINTFFVDDMFLETLNLELVKGRFFSREYGTDEKAAFIVNEAAEKSLGWDDAIDKKLQSPLGQEGHVVGVVKDFNYKSLHSPIEPLIIMNIQNSQGFLLVKVNANDIRGTMDEVSKNWKAFDPGHPYDYFFLDAKFQEQYEKEERLTEIFSYFSILAIVISCLGLIGLAVFTNELKIKEIGIRKTFGASQVDIIIKLSSGFLVLILIANIIAWPVSYYLIDAWLSEFSFRIELTLIPFVLALLIAFVIAFITIGYFASKAAKQDIISALKYE